MCLRTCRYCGEQKEEDQFERNGSRATYRCMSCAALYHRKRYRKTEDGVKMLLRGRVNSLRAYCEKHDLQLVISVKKGKEKWI